MKRPETPLDPRAEELLADRALYGLEAAEVAELRALGFEEDTSFDEAAAAIDLATLKLEPMPERIAKHVTKQDHRRTPSWAHSDSSTVPVLTDSSGEGITACSAL